MQILQIVCLLEIVLLQVVINLILQQFVHNLQTIIKDFIVSLLGILSAFVCVIVIDKIFAGSSRAFTAQIISDNYEDINSKIIEKLGRTTTIVYAKGGFTLKDRKIIIFSFTVSEYADVINVVNSVDKNAFITINRAHEINGNGWPKKQ